MASISERYERLVEAGLVLAAELTGARYGALRGAGPRGAISEFITTGVTDACT
jgi:hypothetical protein